MFVLSQVLVLVDSKIFHTVNGNDSFASNFDAIHSDFSPLLNVYQCLLLLGCPMFLCSYNDQQYTALFNKYKKMWKWEKPTPFSK